MTLLKATRQLDASTLINSVHVERCLEAYNDVNRLSVSQLCKLTCVKQAAKVIRASASRPIVNSEEIDKRSDGDPVLLGHALRQVIDNTLARVKPENREGVPLNELNSDDELYQILHGRYLNKQGKSHYAALARRFHISKSTLYRRINTAINLLVVILQQIEDEARSTASSSDQSDDVGTTPTDTFEQIQTARYINSSKTAAFAPLLNVDHFVGRDSLIQDIKRRLHVSSGSDTGGSFQLDVTHVHGKTDHDDLRNLALWGLPGVGKTTLLLRLAHDADIQATFTDGILWASLGQSPNFISILNAWCMALGVPRHDLNEAISIVDKARLIHDSLKQKRVLILLDDVWQMPEVLDVKIRTPHSALIMSTRFPLVAAASCGSSVIQVPELNSADSMELLETYAPEAVRNFRDQSLQLLQTLGGLPLALSIAGQHLRRASYLKQTRRIHQAFEGLEDALSRLRLTDDLTETQGVEASHRSLESVIEQSLALLDDESQQAFCQLTMHPAKPNTFSEQAALTIAGVSTDVLDEFIDLGLLEVTLPDSDTMEARYAIHQVIADCARMRLKSGHPWRRMVRYYADWLERVSHDDDSIRLIQKEFHNIVAVYQHVQDVKRDDHAYKIALALYPYLQTQALWGVAVDMLSPLVTADKERIHVRVRIDVLSKLARSHLMMRQTANAEALAQAASLLVDRANDVRIKGDVYELQAQIAIDKGQFSSAVDCCKRALECANACDDPNLSAQVRTTLTVALAGAGDLATAEQMLQPPTSGAPDAVSLLAAGSDFQDEAGLVNTFISKAKRQARRLFCQKNAVQSMTLLLHGKLIESERAMRIALDAAREANDPPWIINCAAGLSWLAMILGKYDEFALIMTEGLAVARGTSQIEGVVFLHCNQALLSLGQAQFDDAEMHIQNAITLARIAPSSKVLGLSSLLATYGRIFLASGKFNEARKVLREALSLPASHMERIAPLAMLGFVYTRDGDLVGAEKCLDDAFNQVWRLGLFGSHMMTMFARHYSGWSAMHVSKTDKALTDFAMAFDFALRTKSPQCIGVTALNVACAYAHERRLTETVHYASVSLTHLQSIKHAHAGTALELHRRAQTGLIDGEASPAFLAW